MTPGQFDLEFEILNGYYDKVPRKATAAAWFRELETYDIETFRQVVADYASADPDKYGKYWFPHISDIKAAYRRLKTGKEKFDNYIPSCDWCDHGKIYLSKVNKSGLITQPYIYRCGACDPYLLQDLIPVMQPFTYSAWQERGWRLDWALQRKWDSVAAGTWKTGGETRLTLKMKEALVGEKSNEPAVEKTRATSLYKASEKTDEIPF